MSGTRFGATDRPPPAGRRRVILAALVVLEAAVFGALSRTLALPAAAAVAAVLGALPRERVRASRLQLIFAAGGVGAACLALWRVVPHYRPSADMDPAVGAFGHALGQWALAVQAGLLFLDWGRDGRGRPRLPVAAPALGVAVLLSAGDIKATEPERAGFLLAAVAFALLCGLYWSAGGAAGSNRGAPRRGRWARRAVLVGAAAAVGGATWGASLTLRRYERTMDRIVRQFLQPEPLTVAAGFGGEARLGDVADRKAFAGRSVALRCYSGSAPGYLRGRAYYTLATDTGVRANGTRWVGGGEETRARIAADVEGADALRSRRGEALDAARTRYLFDFTRPPVVPAAKTGRSLDEEEVFPPVPPPPPGGRRVEVWPAGGFRGTVFAPPATVRLVGPEPVLDADEYGLTLTVAVGAPHYTVDAAGRSTPPGSLGTGALGTGGPPNPLPAWGRTAAAVDPADPRCVAVPDLLAGDPAVRAAADAAFARSRTPAGHIAAVETYFRRNYAYQFGGRVSRGGNPLSDFLARKPAAHCEYFATAATLLLRTRGVPARYVTGFVAAERNAVGGYWVARNADAHAWCEAWDPARGWVVVEATPAAGVPDGAGGANWFADLWDAAAAAVARWRQSFAERGWGWLLSALAGAAATGPGLALLVTLLAAAGWRVRRVWRGRRAEDPVRRRVRAALRRADRRLRRRGLVRSPEEPPHDFAARVAAAGEDEVAAWYAATADRLYRPGETASG